MDSSLQTSFTLGSKTFSGITTPLPSPGADMIVVDLRTNEDFKAWRLPLSTNLPLKTLSSETCNPFEDSSTLERQWLEMHSLFQGDMDTVLFENEQSMVDRQVLVVCYDGDTSRVCTSILRAKKIEAFSMRGGIRGMLLRWPELHNEYVLEVETRESS